MEGIKSILGKSAIEFKAIPFTDRFITGLNYAYKTIDDNYFMYDTLTGKRCRISAERYKKISQDPEVLI